MVGSCGARPCPHVVAFAYPTSLAYRRSTSFLGTGIDIDGLIASPELPTPRQLVNRQIKS